MTGDSPRRDGCGAKNNIEVQWYTPTLGQTHNWWFKRWRSTVEAKAFVALAHYLVALIDVYRKATDVGHITPVVARGTLAPTYHELHVERSDISATSLDMAYPRVLMLNLSFDCLRTPRRAYA